MQKINFQKYNALIKIAVLLFLFVHTSISAAPLLLPRPVTLQAETIAQLKQAHENEKSEWQLVVFGFTHCKDICPTSLANLSMLVEAADDEQINLEGTFVTIDPDRDSEEALATYTKSFGSNIGYLRFEDEELEQFKRTFGVEVEFLTKNAGNMTHYQVDHSTTAFLIDPEGRIRVMFDAVQDAPSIAKMFQDNKELFKL